MKKKDVQTKAAKKATQTKKVTPKTAKLTKRQTIEQAITKMPKGAVDYAVTSKTVVTEAERPNPMQVFFVEFSNGKEFTTQKAEDGKGVDVFRGHTLELKKMTPKYCGTADSLADAVYGMVTGRYRRHGK